MSIFGLSKRRNRNFVSTRSVTEVRDLLHRLQNTWFFLISLTWGIFFYTTYSSPLNFPSPQHEFLLFHKFSFLPFYVHENSEHPLEQISMKKWLENTRFWLVNVDAFLTNNKCPKIWGGGNCDVMKKNVLKKCLHDEKNVVIVKKRLLKKCWRHRNWWKKRKVGL